MKILLAIIALVIIPPLVMVASAFYRNDLPWTAPPGPLTRLKTYISTHVARTAEQHPYPELRSLHVRMPAGALRDSLTEMIDRLGWVLAPQAAGDDIHAVVTTPLFKYRDDIHIMLRPLADGSVAVDVESISRVGHGDLGTNTRHVLDLYRMIRSDPDITVLP